jgi:hypothetical protein
MWIPIICLGKNMKPSIFHLMIEYLKDHNDVDYLTNLWLYGLEMEIYVRKGPRLLDERMTTCLDIANVTVYKPGLGFFTLFLRLMEVIIKDYDSFEAIYIESVQTERFGWFLEREGYTRIPDSLPPSYFKMKEML